MGLEATNLDLATQGPQPYIKEVLIHFITEARNKLLEF